MAKIGEDIQWLNKLADAVIFSAKAGDADRVAYLVDQARHIGFLATRSLSKGIWTKAKEGRQVELNRAMDRVQAAAAFQAQSR